MNKNLLWVGAGLALLFFMSKKEDATVNPDGTTITPIPENLTGEQLVQAWINKIKSTPEWMEEIIRKAPDYGNTIEQQLRFDAEYVINQGWQLT